jgi:hypothetical protein
MTVANVNVTKVLLKRGNTAQNNNYTGVNGELTIDTQAVTLRIHDGTTAGGTVINAGGVAGSYSNTNAAAYLESQSITSANIGGSQTFANANAAVQATAINSLNANIGAFQSYANITLSTIANAASQESAINSINANVGAYQTFANANAASQTTEIDSLRANITAANTAITGLQSNAAVQAALLDTLTGNAATQSQVLDTLTTNAATQATTLTTLLSNAVAQQTSLIDLVANAATQAQFISNTNANTKSYLSAFDGNIIPSANVTYSLGDATHQWRDLWVSNNTIYIGNTPVRVHNGTLLVNDTAIADTVTKLTNGAYTFNLFANGQSRSPDTVFASNGVSIINANGAIQGGIYNSGDADWFNIGASTGRGIKFYVDEETEGPLFFANGSVNVPSNLYSAAGVIGDVSMYGGTIAGTNPNWNNLTIANQVEGSVFVQLPSEATANVANLRIHNDIGNVELATGDGFSYNYWYFRNDGNLTIPGNINYANGTSILSGLGGAVTGNISVDTSAIQFVASSSGDGNGYSTIRIIPDTNLEGTDQYLIVDPTVINHIHIRAGGTQDNSSADLFLGGENSYVKLPAGLNPNVEIAANTHVWNFNSTGLYGELVLPAGEGAIRTNDDTISLVSLNTTTGFANTVYLGSSGGVGFFDQAIGGNWLEIFRSGSEPEIRVPVGRGSLNIQTTDGVTPYNWTFANTGNLTLPTNGSIKFSDNTTISSSGVTTPATAGGALETFTWQFSDIMVGSETITLEWNLLGANQGDFYLATNYSTTPKYFLFDGTNKALSFLTSPGVDDGGKILFGNMTANATGTNNDIELRSTSSNVYISANTSIWKFNNNGNLIFPDSTVQTTAWTGSVAFGNTIAIGYNTGTVSQGGGAVAVGPTAGNVSQGIGAVAVGEAAGTLSQGTEGIAIGKTAGEQSQGAYSIAIGSAAAYYQQRTGAIAIGTSAGALQQGNHAIAIGTGAGSALQGNNSIILNATGSALEQTTDNTFTVKPIRNASSSTVLYYDSTTGEITYDTAGAGTYGNTEVAAYLPAYTGNVGAARVQVTNAVDFMYGGFPYMGWQLSGSDTLKLRTNIASGDYTNDAVIVDRQSLAVNVVATLSAGNIITTSGVFWSNGVAYSTGSGTYGNTEVAAYLLTWPNVDVNILDTTSANITTLRATNFNSANAVISGGYISALTNASVITATVTTLNSTGGNITTLRATNFGTANAVITGGYINSLANLTATTAVFTNFSTGNAVINGGYISSLTNASITTSVVTNFSTANAVITGGYASGLANVTAIGNVTAGNIIGYGTNTSIIAGAYTSTFDIAGNVILPNAYVSGNTTIMGIAPGYAPNRPAFRIYGSSSNNWTTANVNFKGSDIVVDYNQGSYFDSTTGIFTAPVAGLYSITLNARIGNNNGQNQIMVLKNAQTSAGNVAVMWECDTNTGTAVHYGVSSVMKLAAGDFLTANITVGTVQFDANDSWTVTYIG